MATRQNVVRSTGSITRTSFSAIAVVLLGLGLIGSGVGAQASPGASAAPGDDRVASRAGCARRGTEPPGAVGGDEGTRTPDLCDANAALFQLSYIPTEVAGGHVGGRSIPPAPEVRPQRRCHADADLQ